MRRGMTSDPLGGKYLVRCPGCHFLTAPAVGELCESCMIVDVNRHRDTPVSSDPVAPAPEDVSGSSVLDVPIGLPPLHCAYQGCGVFFAPRKVSQRFCCVKCAAKQRGEDPNGKAQLRAALEARRPKPTVPTPGKRETLVIVRSLAGITQAMAMLDVSILRGQTRLQALRGQEQCLTEYLRLQVLLEENE